MIEACPCLGSPCYELCFAAVHHASSPPLHPPSLPTCGRYPVIHFQTQVCKRLRPAEIPIRGRVSAPFPFQAEAQASFVEHSVTSFDEPAGIVAAEEASWFD